MRQKGKKHQQTEISKYRKKYSLMQSKIKEENPKKSFPEVKVYRYRENA